MARNHKPLISPMEHRLIPFAARSGYTKDDLDDPALKERLMDDYSAVLRPRTNRELDLIVHRDGATDFYTFADPKDMWCCRV